ncbi:murein hydrolase activator EnvC family protein [Caulobacter segnis]|uniref:murein hydrolase activator EnvC family protein n=1 Tax=Caulobacter segnis TaxID=88688 RepID=UPI001CBE52DC|nr:peptidoglycan DD-metalloendopeptidase family protein [Caulobacter segnis]UAL10375.1 peptidoglycan DD-metalloendopeptidase family protein [Caulobacter segnis]
MLRRPSLPVIAFAAALVAVPTAVVGWQRADQAIEAQRAKDRQQAADTRREIQDLRAELDRLDHARLAAGADVDAKRARLEALNARERSILADLGVNRQRLSLLLSALQLFRRDPPPALLVSPDNARDAVRAAILIRAMTPELQRRADAYARQATAVGTLRREAAAASAELFTAESVVADRKGEIERLIIEKTQLERAFAHEALAEESELRTLGALTDGLGRVEATGPLHLRAPAAGAIVRRFGQEMPAGGKSPGLTLRVDKGLTVTAPAAGTVEYSGALNGWGAVLILRSQGAYHLVLAGLDQITASPGQSVAAGAPIGKMPDHVSSDPELYMEVRENGEPADPERWLKQESR